jgi:hypothetical protein
VRLARTAYRVGVGNPRSQASGKDVIGEFSQTLGVFEVDGDRECFDADPPLGRAVPSADRCEDPAVTDRRERVLIDRCGVDQTVDAVGRERSEGSARIVGARAMTS